MARDCDAAGPVLNDHWEEMRTAGFLSNRLFDAVASGARAITDDVAGLGNMTADLIAKGAPRRAVQAVRRAG